MDQGGRQSSYTPSTIKNLDNGSDELYKEFFCAENKHCTEPDGAGACCGFAEMWLAKKGVEDGGEYGFITRCIKKDVIKPGMNWTPLVEGDSSRYFKARCVDDQAAKQIKVYQDRYE